MSCEYGSIKQNSIYCNLIKDNCCFIRWCYNSQCIKQTDGYINCKARSGEMAKKKIDEIENTEFTPNEEIEVNSENKENIMIKQQEYKKELCKVLWSKNNKIAVGFKDYGITIDGNTDQEYIEVQYESDIGKPDFKAFI